MRQDHDAMLVLVFMLVRCHGSVAQITHICLSLRSTDVTSMQSTTRALSHCTYISVLSYCVVVRTRG